MISAEVPPSAKKAHLGFGRPSRRISGIERRVGRCCTSRHRDIHGSLGKLPDDDDLRYGKTLRRGQDWSEEKDKDQERPRGAIHESFHAKSSQEFPEFRDSLKNAWSPQINGTGVAPREVGACQDPVQVLGQPVLILPEISAGG